LTGLQRFADSDITPFAFPESDIAQLFFFCFKQAFGFTACVPVQRQKRQSRNSFFLYSLKLKKKRNKKQSIWKTGRLIDKG
jgi:hypothetical protein